MSRIVTKISRAIPLYKNFKAFTFSSFPASLSVLLMPEMKIAIFANLLGAMSRQSADRGLRMRVNMLSLFIMFKDSLAVINYPVYSAMIVFAGMMAVDTM